MEFCNDCRKMVYVRTITDENNDTNYEVCAKCGNDNFGAVLDFRKSPNITNHLITTNMNDFTTIPTTTFNALRNEAMEAIRDRKSTRLNSSHITISYAV